MYVMCVLCCVLSCVWHVSCVCHVICGMCVLGVEGVCVMCVSCVCHVCVMCVSCVSCHVGGASCCLCQCGVVCRRLLCPCVLGDCVGACGDN